MMMFARRRIENRFNLQFAIVAGIVSAFILLQQLRSDDSAGTVKY
jgi:hypothetical protein